MNVRLWFPAVLIGLVGLRECGCTAPIGPGVRTVEVTYSHTRPSWSPDGASIAFTSTILGVQGIYVVDSLGGPLRLVKSGEGIGITWSPDSRWIAFSASSRISKVTTAGDSLTLVSQKAVGIRPSWSPDGFTIVYVNNGLKTVTLATDAITTLVPYGDFPTWKNADEVVFLTTTAPGSHQFLSYRLSSREETVLSSLSGNSDRGFSSVNLAGTAIVFSAQTLDRTEYAQVYVLSLLDLSIVRITDDGGDHPAWSPDGSQIVYVRPVKGDGGLWIVNADGTGKRRLTQP